MRVWCFRIDIFVFKMSHLNFILPKWKWTLVEFEAGMDFNRLPDIWLHFDDIFRRWSRQLILKGKLCWWQKRPNRSPTSVTNMCSIFKIHFRLKISCFQESSDRTGLLNLHNFEPGSFAPKRLDLKIEINFESLSMQNSKTAVNTKSTFDLPMKLSTISYWLNRSLSLKFSCSIKLNRSDNIPNCLSTSSILAFFLSLAAWAEIRFFSRRFNFFRIKTLISYQKLYSIILTYVTKKYVLIRFSDSHRVFQYLLVSVGVFLDHIRLLEASCRNDFWFWKIQIGKCRIQNALERHLFKLSQIGQYFWSVVLDFSPSPISGVDNVFLSGV